MKKIEKIYKCIDCGKNIFVKNNEEQKKFKPKVCAECFIYRQQKVQKFCFVSIFVSLFFAILLILPISEKFQFKIALVLFFVGIFLLIFVLLLKFISRKIYFDD